MKKLIYAALIGGFISSTLVAWFSPQIISWYFAPPMDLVVSCKPAVEWGIYAYRKATIIGGIMGFVAGAGVYFLMQRRKTTTPSQTSA